MNSILDTTGALLYFVLSIVLIPVFLLTDLLLWSVVAYRALRRFCRRLSRLRLHRPHWPALDRQLALMRKRALALVHWHP